MRPRQDTEKGEMKRILIVDDSHTSVRLFTALLEGPNYQLSVATSGSEALRACIALKPHLVLLDLHLPGMDGFEVARRLKGDSSTLDIPILAVTAYGHGHANEAALEAGVDQFMAKPFSGVALREAVAAFVDGID
jgi:two-component system cell cycle response regulator